MVSERRTLRPLVVFAGSFVVGLVAFFAVGVTAAAGAWLNVLLIAGGAGIATFGASVVQKPTAFDVSPNEGTDAFGEAQWGATRPATSAEGTANGVSAIVMGILLTALGVFLGALPGAG